MNQDNNFQNTNIENSGGAVLNAPVSKNAIRIVVVAVIVVVLSLMYVWGGRVDEKRQEELSLPPLPQTDAQIEVLERVGESDELSAIEEDLTATDIERLDSDLDEVETELTSQINAESN